jgi:hypothetical protein
MAFAHHFFPQPNDDENDQIIAGHTIANGVIGVIGHHHPHEPAFYRDDDPRFNVM